MLRCLLGGADNVQHEGRRRTACDESSVVEWGRSGQVMLDFMHVTSSQTSLHNGACTKCPSDFTPGLPTSTTHIETSQQLS